MNPVKIGLLGLGTVGQGTVSVLRRNAVEIARRAGRGIQITDASTRDINKERSCSLDNLTLFSDPFQVVDQADIQIIVEVIGGTEIALQLVMRAIENGKHVVTANKALIALHGNEIFAAAQRRGVIVAFEAAVAGGIPIIKAMREGLSANRIESIAGIINGTCNFILSAMAEQGRELVDILAEAQKLGYAESDPSFDIGGIDAAHKLTILAAIAFGIPLQFDKVYIEGMTRICTDDLGYADQLGYRIKHLGIAKRTTTGIELRVHPTLIPKDELMANVNGVKNAILVNGDAVGSTIYYGTGAGAEPTASAVVADVVDTVRALTSDPDNRVPHLAFKPDALSDESILDMNEVETAYYLRMLAVDCPGTLAEITKILSDSSISIEAILQKKSTTTANYVPIVFLTHRVQERNINTAIQQIENLEITTGEIKRIRVETLA